MKSLHVNLLLTDTPLSGQYMPVELFQEPIESSQKPYMETSPKK